MAHNYQYLFDEWAASGTKTMPSVALKTTGFVAGMKPPASVFNYQWDKIGRAITELQENALTEDPSGGIWQKLKPVATSGSYNDLYNKPELKAVATSGSYTDLINAPAFGTYVGDGTGNVTEDGMESPRTITLPFAPSVVLLFCGYRVVALAQGDTTATWEYSNGLTGGTQTYELVTYRLSGSSLQVVATAQASLQVSYGFGAYSHCFAGNLSGVSYHWVALP